MGKKGKEIITMDKEYIIAQLKKAFALEWVVHYYASIAANLVSGINAEVFEKIFNKASAGEFEHANRIAKRLSELGAEPPTCLNDIEQISGIRKINFPEKTSDIKSFLNIFIDLERQAIAHYNELANKTHGKDLVTHELAEDLLAEEVSEEEEYENMLRE